MKKFVYTGSFKLLILSFLLASCSGILVPDPIDPRIPKYTEVGNDVAGAFVNANVWQSIVYSSLSYTVNEPEITAYTGKDSLSVRFTGNISGEDRRIEFHIKGFHLDELDDLLKLNGQKIQLDGLNASAYYSEDYDQSAFSAKGIGQIYFRNVKKDNSPSSIVLSGTFGFSINDGNGDIIKVSSGRFDYRLTDNNFHIE